MINGDIDNNIEYKNECCGIYILLKRCLYGIIFIKCE
jgi:hypothetical protein